MFRACAVNSRCCVAKMASSVAGPSEVCIEATVALTVQLTGNGESTSTSSDTPRRPRKRPRRPESWKKTVAKTKRAKGEEYVSPTTSKTVPARVTGPDCRCRRKCFQRIQEGERASILTAFYQLGNKNLQDAHLFGLIRSNPVKRRRPRGARGGRDASHRAVYAYSVSMNNLLQM